MAELSIAALRHELGWTLDRFAREIGLSSKGNASIIERDNRAGLNVALRIEELSIKDGVPRIDAATINDDVARARSTPATPTNMAPDADNARTVICTECEERLDADGRGHVADCPLAQREAA